MSLNFDKSKVRILVTDDEDSIRSMLMTTLTDAGWSVDGAKTGKDAIEKLRQSSFHIVLSDINMPEMTGIELLEAVRREFPLIEFVIMTSHATIDTAIKAVSLGAYDYLHKPFEDINLVPRKMEKVAEKILLRQQNNELLRRLKVATHDLKRLFQVVSPLNGVLEMQELRKKSVEGFGVLFDDPTTRASWWARNQEGVWECVAAAPNDEEFKKFPDPASAKEGIGNLRSPILGAFVSHDGREETILFENLKDASTQIYLQQIDLCFEKASQHAEIAAMANKDGLTRLYNHRYFQERMRQELAQAQRQKSGMSVILIDVDHFKNYNDRNGHPAGDTLLRQLADLMSQHRSGDGASKRVTDILARYGGEEFVLILPFTLHDGALVKAERIRAAVEAHPFPFADGQPLGKVSLSIGVSSFPDHGITAEELIGAADRSLYIAKRKGRNRVVSANEMDSVDPMAVTQEFPKPGNLESSPAPAPAPEAAPVATPAKTLGAFLTDETDATERLEIIEEEVSSPERSEVDENAQTTVQAEPIAPMPPQAAVEVTVVSEKPTVVNPETDDVTELAAKMEKLTEESQKELEETQKKLEAFKVGMPATAIDFDLGGLMSAIDQAVKDGKAKG